MKIAVTGAFSYSGKYIAHRFLARGEEVITLTNHSNRGDPFGGRIKAHPMDFRDKKNLISTLQGVNTLINTYWIRFDRGGNTQSLAVKNTKILMEAAAKAGINRIVHVSITNPSPDSHLPYFRGKAMNEGAVIESGASYAILRPTVLFGREDILINNVAWLLRRFPFFILPGDGNYRLSPVYVDDLAELAVEAAYGRENLICDAVGPDEFTFREMVHTIGDVIGVNKPLLPMHPRFALGVSQILGYFLRDVMLTPDEVEGLMANLLVSHEPPRCKTSLLNWLEENRESVGRRYASELLRHY